MNATLDRVRRRTGVSLAFGGQVVDNGSLNLEFFSGSTLGALSGVALSYGTGLGGRAVALRRPIAVPNYFQSNRISHDYDPIIRAERLRSLGAAPVIVNRKPVGVLYAAFRSDEVVGDRILTTLIDEARSLEQEFVMLEAVRERDVADPAADAERLRTRIRLAYGELRALSATITDDGIRDSIKAIADPLRDAENRPRRRSALTVRETDVLALAASGLTNPQIAERLGLTLFTVKGYMKTAMSKMQARSRHEAVIAARLSGILP